MEPVVYSEMAALEDTHWWFVARRRILGHVISGLELPRDADILDVGCGTGGNLALLSKYGRVSALEMNEAAREYSLQRGICEVRYGRLPDEIPYPDSQFDLIVLLDILEHVEPDSQSLAAVAGKLKPGGAMLITVPAFPILWGPHDVRHHHKRRYTQSRLQRLFPEAGLFLSFLTHFNTLLFPIILGVRLVQKITGADSNQGLKVPPPFLNTMLSRIFASERFAVGRFYVPFGLSLLALARKPVECKPKLMTAQRLKDLKIWGKTGESEKGRCEVYLTTLR